MRILAATLKALKFPLKLLIQLVGGKRKANMDALSERLKRSKKTELEQKQLAHVRNFDPTCLKNKSWQQRSGKKSTKKQKKRYKKKLKKSSCQPKNWK